VIIDTHLGFKKRYSLHGLASQVTYRLRDEMAHAIAAKNRIVSLLATCYQNQIESVLTCRDSYRVALLDEDSVAQEASPGPPLPFYSILDDVTVICISRVVLSFRDNLGSKKQSRGPLLACFLNSHRDQGPFNALAGFYILLRNIKQLPHLHKEGILICADSTCRASSLSQFR
jgi:hypothetical protein